MNTLSNSNRSSVRWNKRDLKNAFTGNNEAAMEWEDVRCAVENEVRLANARLADWNTRLMAHALARRHGQLTQAQYAGEVESWRTRFHRELHALHLKSAAAAWGNLSRLQQASVQMSVPLARVDELARGWLETPPTEMALALERGESEAEGLLWGALEVFDELRRGRGPTSLEWDEAKHPRDRKGRFGYGSEGINADASMTVASDDVVAKIVHKGALTSVNHAKAQAARERILEIDKQYEVKIAKLKHRRNEAYIKMEEINDKTDSQRKINPHLLPATKHFDYQRLDAQTKRLSSQIINAHRERRREIWNQLVVPEPTRFHVDYNEITDKNKRGKIESGVTLIGQLVDRSIVENLQLIFVNTQEERSFYHAGKIHLSGKPSSFTVAHEIGHHLEDHHPELLAELIKYRGRRVEEAKNSGKNVELKQIPGYDEDEIGYIGVFHDDYIARAYHGNKASEILSMGLEYYAVNPAEFAEVDADMFDFIYNVVRGRI